MGSHPSGTDGFNSAALRPSNASKIVALAVDGVARACIDDPEQRLIRMLRDGIDTVTAFTPVAAPARAVVEVERPEHTAPPAAQVAAPETARRLVR